MVKVSVYLRGDQLDPEGVTDLLGVRPSEALRKGEQHGTGGKFVADIGIWALFSQSQSLTMSNQIGDLISTLSSTKVSLDRLPGVSEAYLDIFIPLPDGEQRPFESFVSEQHLHALCRLGLSIHFTVT